MGFKKKKELNETTRYLIERLLKYNIKNEVSVYSEAGLFITRNISNFESFMRDFEEQFGSQTRPIDYHYQEDPTGQVMKINVQGCKEELDLRLQGKWYAD